MIENENCTHIRTLITEQTRNEKWYKEVKKIIGLNQYVVNNQRALLKAFKPGWGKISLHKLSRRTEILWVRPDGGPNITVSTEQDPLEGVMQIALRAILISELNQSGLASFVKVGYPEYWKRCVVRLNDNVLDHVVWACAIIGLCIVHDVRKPGEKELREKQLEGKVVIQIEQEQKGFF